LFDSGYMSNVSPCENHAELLERYFDNILAYMCV